jgi:outer membrane protein assembly factor BamB
MPDRTARRPRLWFPALVVGLAAAAVTGLWAYPDHDQVPNDLRGFFSTVSVLLAALLLALWLLFFSGARWAARLGVLAVVAMIFFGAVRAVEFQGNMLPVFHFRWEPSAEARRAARSAQDQAGRVKIPEPTDADFPEYRNRSRDGVVNVGRLAHDWSARPPKRLWQEAVGGGYAGIAVVGPSAVTLEQVGGEEAVVCYDADNGRERWSCNYPARFSEAMGGDGPRATPTIADGDVYSLGASGELVRLDGETGRPKWRVNVLENNDNIQWGMSGSPLVYDRFVVVNPGAQRESAKGRAVVAYDRDSGQAAWAAGDRKAGYSSPQLATLAGTRQVLVFDGEALGAYEAATGKELWSHEWRTNPEVNVAQPLVFDGDRVFISSGYGHGCAMLKVSQAEGQWKVEELWKNTSLKCKFTSPVSHGGFIYGIDESTGNLVCLDAKTGQRKWRDGRYGNGQVLLAGDLLVVGAENGRLVLVQATPDAFRELASFPALEGRKNWNYLTIARGRAYLRNHETMVCYELPREAP